MKFGFFLPTMASFADPKQVIEFAILAEKSGWDGVFLPDHLMHHDSIPWLDANIMMTAIVCNTKNIKVGSWITPVVRRQPWQLAKELATLDILSNGRIILGAGIGAPPSDYTSFGIKYENMGEKLDEALEILDLCWKGETFDFEGKYYQLKDVRLLPKPIQKPRIPILIGGKWPGNKPFIRGAKWDGMMPISKQWPKHLTIEEIKELTSFINSERKKHTNENAELLIQLDISEINNIHLLSKLYELGVTWILFGISPRTGSVEQIKQAILHGPPKL
ncbi:MAG: LLM class flavin-dependent oxidoreductase [Candidatus Heimdallarchaeota archaeon]|nr:LLM class flavin-dependent oxidoreductase [Candidatus Heimdallarchaeota archaeon]